MSVFGNGDVAERVMFDNKPINMMNGDRLEADAFVTINSIDDVRIETKGLRVVRADGSVEPITFKRVTS